MSIQYVHYRGISSDMELELLFYTAHIGSCKTSLQTAYPTKYLLKMNISNSFITMDNFPFKYTVADPKGVQEVCSNSICDKIISFSGRYFRKSGKINE